MAETGTTTAAEPRTGRRPRTRKMMLAIIVVILLGMFVPPFVNVNRYRSNITASLSNAVGRPVTVGHLELRLLPQPGFDLRSVEVGDDPAMSAEYLLHADRVTAYLRLSSLWRGRLEIARLSLTDPSLNLVRAADGRWNIETLLARTTQIPTAPTSQSHFESSRRRFPYIEATGGRINFKFGLEKKAFTFTDADFALWLASENNWNMRLEARPYRVDTRVTDTGAIKMEGSFQRNSMLRYTPVKFSFSWRDAQLGQMTKLLTGRDRGWRGGTAVDVSATGTPADLAIVSDVWVDDFRRYDIFSPGDTRLSAHCTGHLSAPEQKVSDLKCQAPVGEGSLELDGTVQRAAATFYDLSIAGHNVSLDSVMHLVRHAKRDLPEDLSATGTTDFGFSAKRAAGSLSSQWAGGGSTTNLEIHSQALGPVLPVGTLTYTISPAVTEKTRHTMRGVRIDPTPAQPNNEFRLAVAPFPLQLGAVMPVAAQAIVTTDGFTVSIAGDTDLARALQVARALGIDTPAVAATGAAKVDLHIDGHWTGFEAPSIVGTSQFKNVQADIPGINETVQVSTASATIDAKTLGLQNVVATFPHGPALNGSVSVPRNCSRDDCTMTFTVHADELSPERLNALLNPKLRSRPWYNFFMPRPAGPMNPAGTAQAAGQVSIDRWNMRGTLLAHAAATVRVSPGHVVVTDLRGDLLGGQHLGEWEADFTTSKPVYIGKGRVVRASLAQLGVTMQDAWATGTADMTYQLKLSGNTPEELRSSASGIGEFSVRDGNLRRMGLDSKTAALKFSKLDGTVTLRDRNFVFNDAKLQSASEVYNVQGTASWKGELNFSLTDHQHSYALSGTLDRPEIKAAPATEANLQSKP